MGGKEQMKRKYTKKYPCPTCGNQMDYRSKTCHGCYLKSLGGDKNPCFKHGDNTRKSTKRLYRIWVDMKTRCFYPSHSCYHRYGGRGITVCPEWVDDYIAFKTWSLATGYKNNLTIDRVDNNKGYYPENCQWITLSENVKKENYN